MGKFDISKVFGSLKNGVIKHSPEILTGIGITGSITALIMVAKATPKAVVLLDEVKETRTDDKKEYALQVVKKVAPVYIPAVVVEGLSIACIIGATKVNFKRKAALATAYSLSESALREYQSKVIETIGEKKEKQICDEIAQDHVKNNPISNNEVIITGKGQTLFCESITGQYFESDMEKVRSVQNDLNDLLNDGDTVSLNEELYEFGARQTPLGQELGFERNLTGLIKFKFSAVITEDGRPCIYIGYDNPPVYNFDMYG